MKRSSIGRVVVNPPWGTSLSAVVGLRKFVSLGVLIFGGALPE